MFDAIPRRNSRQVKVGHVLVGGGTDHGAVDDQHRIPKMSSDGCADGRIARAGSEVVRITVNTLPRCARGA